LDGVSIGGALAEARQLAGLTVADVSARTRIRQPIIRAIERDDFGPCGGDFYARGHIRAIARAVGTDAEPLIREYDAALERSAGPPAPERPVPGRRERDDRRRRRARPSASFLAVLAAGLLVLGFGSYRLASSGPSAARSTAASTARGLAARGSGRQAAAPPAPRPSVPASPRRGTPARTPPAAQRPPAARSYQVTPVSAAAFGPAGTSDGDNPQNARLALSGNPSDPWQTDWYTTARFGNLQAGTGLLLGLGRTVTMTAVTIDLGAAPGADLQVRAGTSPGSLSTVASASGAGGTVRLRLASPARARYLLIWFTLLPPDSSGTYQADVSGVTVTAAG
jgi:cytoskeletal protein RodZ